MHWLESLHWPAALVVGAVCGVLGWFAPRVIARIPEPEPAPPADPGSETDTAPAPTKLAPPPPKEPYADIAALPHLPVHLAGWSALVGGVFAAQLGWTGALLYLAPLVPVGVALLVIDWRTTLLPTRIIHPTYLGLAVLIPAAALVDGDLTSLVRAGWGWLVIGAWFWGFWWLFGAWGFGDVRLARVLGPALGYLGWAHIMMGLALMVFVGGIGGVVLAAVNRSLRRRFPYGPFMLVGAAIAVVAAPALARGLGY